MLTKSAIPPGPRGSPFLGNAATLSREGLAFLERCAHDYGDIVRLQFFWKPILFLNHPDDIEKVFVASHRKVIKNIAQRADHALIGDGLFLSEGDFWLRQRRLMQPAFHRDRIAAYGENMVDCAEQLLESWADGEARDIYQDMSRLTMEVVSKALFGSDVWDVADDVSQALALALDCLDARVRSVQVLLPESLPTPTNLRMRRARSRIDSAVYRIIEERRARGGDRGDLLDMLMGARDDEGTRMTDRQLRDEVITLFVGGYETAADLLSWVWYLLSRYPEVEAKLLRELETALAGRLPTAGDLPRLPYTGMVVSEALRLYPPAPALGREAVADIEVEGYLIPKGTDILVSQWVMHRDSRYFAAPEVFDPDRWADGLATRLPRFAYFPFGGGPRLCIGNTFAIMEITLILATIAPRFRLEIEPEHPVVAEMIPTLRPKYGLRMVVHRR